ncbi:MAG TPA: DEAD/DEAH box helicase [Victivallales bacterium]|nr:DEAD/DEAH box helicase [Victivallales bacterium]
MLTFKDIGINSKILHAIETLGFEDPMPVQEKVIPVLLSAEKSDLIALAQTGTGKTAAFGLPIIQKVIVEDRITQALVLVPTRELCVQIAGDLRNYAKNIDSINIVAVYGGSDMDRQRKALKKGAHVIVATPGRMNDLLNKQHKIDLSNTNTVVLDEADEMLNMGFKEELDAILEKMPEAKNTLLFSATMSKEVSLIAADYMNDPKKIVIGNKNSGAENVNHLCFSVQPRDRYAALKRIVDFYPDIYCIIFCRTRMETKDIAASLIEDGYNADALHGDLSQAQREYTMNKFRHKSLQILVATDVAARGVDVKDITHVINYNLPDECEVYVHRSGRTGRVRQKGTSVVIATPREMFKVKKIESVLKKKFKTTTVPKGKEICQKQLFSLVDKMQKIEINHSEIDEFLPLVYKKLEWLNREDLIKHFVSLEFNRFLDYYKDAHDLTTPEEAASKRRTERREKGRNNSGRENRNEGFIRFHINLGHKDGMAPSALIGLINRSTRDKGLDIGRIDIMKTFSFFDIKSRNPEKIVLSFDGIEYNNRKVTVEVSKEKLDERNRDFKKDFNKDFKKEKKKKKSRSTRRY